MPRLLGASLGRVSPSRTLDDADNVNRQGTKPVQIMKTAYRASKIHHRFSPSSAAIFVPAAQPRRRQGNLLAFCLSVAAKKQPNRSIANMLHFGHILCFLGKLHHQA